MLPNLTAEHLNASVIGALTATSKAFFLNVPAGTSKKILKRAIHAFLRLRCKKVIAVASSAVAAAILDGGRTVHSTSNILIPCDHESTCNISATSQLAR